MNKLKIALLFSGQARFFDSDSYYSIKKHIIDNPNYECDTYCHFWWDNGVGLKYECSPWNGWNEIQIRSDTFKKLYDLYHPISIKWNFPLARENTDFGLNTIHVNTPYNVRSMYTSLQHVYNQFIETKTKQYDFIIRLRYDTIIESFLNLNLLDKDKFYTFDKYPQIKDIIVNECWITNETDAKHLFNIRNNMYDLYNITNNLSDEQLFTEHCKKMITLEERKNDIIKLDETLFKTVIPYKDTHSYLLN
jgi:hypothetical protein